MSFKKIATDLLVWCARQWLKLPVPFLLAFGRQIGRLLYYLPNDRKRTARINIELCFPEKGLKQRKRLLKLNLIATGQGLIELMMSLWCPLERYISRVTFSGLDNIPPYQEGMMAPVLLTCHTTSIQFGVRCLNSQLEKMGHVLMRQDNNKYLEAHLTKARKEYAGKVIDKKDMRSLLRSLNAGHPVYYAPDQDFSYNYEYVKFYGVPAATTIALAKLAHIKKVAVIPFFCFRTDKKHWHIEVLPQASYFGNADYKFALEQMHLMYQQQINKRKDQYLWVHRRFKTHPKGKNYIYNKYH